MADASVKFAESDRIRASRPEHMARFLACEQAYLTGEAPSKIARRMQVEHKITYRQAERYVSAARRSILARSAHHEQLTLREAVDLAMSRHAQACEAGDFRGAVKYLELVARIMGWYAPRKVEHTGTITHAHGSVDTGTLSAGELEALRAYHEAQQARLTGDVLDSTATVTTEPIE